MQLQRRVANTIRVTGSARRAFIILVTVMASLPAAARLSTGSTDQTPDARTASQILRNEPEFSVVPASALRTIVPPQSTSGRPTPTAMFGGGEERIGTSTVQKFRAALDEAGVPDCLHSEGLKRQPTFLLSGLLALPFIAVAKIRGKCL